MSRSTAPTGSSCRPCPSETAAAGLARIRARWCGRRRRHRALSTSLPAGGLFLPTTLACLGGALIWRQAGDPERDRLRQLSRTSLQARGRPAGTGPPRRRRGAGPGRRRAGAAACRLQRDPRRPPGHAGDGRRHRAGHRALVDAAGRRSSASSATSASAPQERADIAAHLHDSVLQTLALIQRNAGSPREVARLARGQERELRTLLYGSRTASGQLADELRRVARRGRGRLRRVRSRWSWSATPR